VAARLLVWVRYRKLSGATDANKTKIIQRRGQRFVPPSL
jgi:hypothetical protein